MAAAVRGAGPGREFHQGISGAGHGHPVEGVETAELGDRSGENLFLCDTQENSTGKTYFKHKIPTVSWKFEFSFRISSSKIQILI